MIKADRRALGERFVKILCAVLALALLYRWQRNFYVACAGDILSDVPLHIKMALDHDDYGLSSYIIRALYALFEPHRAQTCLSILLAFNNLLCVFALWAMLRFLLPELNGTFAFLASELALVCGPWLIPGIQTGIYIGAHNGNLYHNMTVLFSRTLIPLCFVFFFRCWDRRHDTISFRDWLALTVSLLIITLFKPNFAFAFIPLMAGLLIYELVKHKGAYFKNLVILGCSVLPAGLTCIWQYLVLYDPEFAGNSSGMALQTYTLASFAAMLLIYVRSLLLPLFTVPAQGRKEEHRGHISLLVLTELIALLEASVLTETGYRANHGNFEWGGLAIYPSLFALSIGLLFRMIKTADLKKKGDIVKCAAGAVILLGHLAVGIYFLHIAGTPVSYQI